MKMKHVTLASAVAFATLGLTACVFDGDSKTSNQATILPKVEKETNTNNTSGNNSSTSNSIPKRMEIKINDRLTRLKHMWVVGEVDNYTISVNGQVVKDKIDLSALGKGAIKAEITEQFTDTNKDTPENKANIKWIDDAYLFQQNYSSIAAIVGRKVVIDGKELNLDNIMSDSFIVVKGVATETLPTSGTFNYVGGGQFGIGNGEKETIENAKLSYSVNFDTQSGQGKVDGLSVGEITLNEAKIANFSHHNVFDGTRFEEYGLTGTAENGNKQGAYHFAFFGPNADEISGVVDLDEHDIYGIVGGAKQ